MRKELMEMREALKDGRIAHDMSHAAFCDESHWRAEFNQHTDKALATLDRLLCQDEAKLVEKVKDAIANTPIDAYSNIRHALNVSPLIDGSATHVRLSVESILHQAALRTVGLIGGE